MADDPTILRSRTGADFLASLPTLAGFTAPDSLLLVPFRGTRTTGGALRIGLDALRATDDLAAAADKLVAMLSRIPGCDGAVIVICADESFPVARVLWEPLRLALEDALAASGRHAKDALIQTPDGWGSFHEPDLAADGRPLAEIAASPLAAQSEDARGGEQVRAFDADIAFEEPDPGFATALSEAVVLRVDFAVVADAFGRLSPAVGSDPIALVEDVLRRTGPDEVTVPEYARLIELCATPATRDQMLVQVAFGRQAGVRAARDNARLDAIQARTGRSMDEVVAIEIEAGRRTFGELDTAMVGQTRLIPNRDRIRRAVALLRRAIPAVALPDRAGPLCVLAWMYWATGANTVAAALIRDARRADPTVRMAALLQELIDIVSPVWLFTRE